MIKTKKKHFWSTILISSAIGIAYRVLAQKRKHPLFSRVLHEAGFQHIG